MPESNDNDENVYRVIVNLDEMSSMELWNHSMLMVHRAEGCVETAQKQKVEFSIDLAHYISVLRDGDGKFLDREGMDTLVLRVIAFSHFTKQPITFGLLNEVIDTQDKWERMEEIPEPHPDTYIFDPKSALEMKAYQAYEEKYGHIPVRNLTDKDVEEQKKYYFEILENLKKTQILKGK